MGRTGPDGCGHSGFLASRSAGERGCGGEELRRTGSDRNPGPGLSLASAYQWNQLFVVAWVSGAAAVDPDCAGIFAQRGGSAVYVVPFSRAQREFFGREE